MRAGIIAGIVLALIIAGSLLNTGAILGEGSELSGPLQKAISFAREDNMGRASEEFKEARDFWNSHRHFFQATINGDPLSEIDEHMALAASFLKSDERADFLAECEVVVVIVKETLDSEKLNFENLF
jgi:hypothetical protein